MPLEQLLNWLRERPFRPFRLLLSDGRSFEIRHPEMCMPGRSFVVVGVPDPISSHLITHTVTIGLLHIVSLEPLEVPMQS